MKLKMFSLQSHSIFAYLLGEKGVDIVFSEVLIVVQCS